MRHEGGKSHGQHDVVGDRKINHAERSGEEHVQARADYDVMRPVPAAEQLGAQEVRELCVPDPKLRWQETVARPAQTG